MYQKLDLIRLAGVPRSRAVNLYEVVKLVGMVIAATLVGLALLAFRRLQIESARTMTTS